MGSLPRILCVDDEANILKALARSLRKAYDVTPAGGGREALALLEAAAEPFPVIVSDMRMPEMSGIAFFEEVRRLHPDSVRILLTGYADLEAVVAAVNKGNIFRFLSKPCSVEVLHGALQDGLRQHQLVTGERVLLERTLKGSLKAMTDILAVANPEAFGHADRIRRLANQLVTGSAAGGDWQLEVAAMLSQLGAMTLPPDTASRYYKGEDLTGREREMVARIPDVTCRILGNIPRLETVREMIAFPAEDETPAPVTDHAREERIRRARAGLKLAGDAERLRAAGWPGTRVRDYLRANKGDYDAELLERFEALEDPADECSPVRGVAVHELQVGAVLTEDVRTDGGLLLVAAGQTVTVGLLERICNFHRSNGLKEPLWIRNPGLDGAPASESVATVPA